MGVFHCSVPDGTEGALRDFSKWNILSVRRKGWVAMRAPWGPQGAQGRRPWGNQGISPHPPPGGGVQDMHRPRAPQGAMGTSGRRRAPQGAPGRRPLGNQGKGGLSWGRHGDLRAPKGAQGRPQGAARWGIRGIDGKTIKKSMGFEGTPMGPFRYFLDPSDISRVLQVSPESFRNFRDSSDIFRFPDVPWIPQDVLGISYPPLMGKTFKPVNARRPPHRFVGNVISGALSATLESALESAKGKSPTTCFPPNGCFPPFCARWHGRSPAGFF